MRSDRGFLRYLGANDNKPVRERLSRPMLFGRQHSKTSTLAGPIWLGLLAAPPAIHANQRELVRLPVPPKVSDAVEFCIPSRTSYDTSISFDETENDQF
jgi:hypothetical protein